MYKQFCYIWQRIADWDMRSGR